MKKLLPVIFMCMFAIGAYAKPEAAKPKPAASDKNVSDMMDLVRAQAEINQKQLEINAWQAELNHRFIMSGMMPMPARDAVSGGEYVMPPENKSAETYFGLRLGGGNIWTDDSSYNGKGGATFGLALGAKWQTSEDVAFRLEGEITGAIFIGDYITYDYHYDNWGNWWSYTTKADIQNTAGLYMVNTYIDFLTTYSLKPYIGFGLGATSGKETISYNGGSYSYNHDSQFVFGLYGGFGFNFTSDGSIVGEWGVRYIAAKEKAPKAEMFTSSWAVRFLF